MVVDRKIDFALDFVCEHREIIQKAHLELGIPLEECIASTVRLAIRQLDANPAQLELLWKERKAGEQE